MGAAIGLCSVSSYVVIISGREWVLFSSVLGRVVILGCGVGLGLGVGLGWVSVSG